MFKFLRPSTSHVLRELFGVLVWRPDREPLLARGVTVHGGVGLGHVERFMDIKRLHLQEEWRSLIVLLEPLYRARHDLRGEEVFLTLKVLDVGVIAPSMTRAPVFDGLHPLGHRFVYRNRLPPEILLVPTDQLGALE